MYKRYPPCIHIVICVKKQRKFSDCLNSYLQRCRLDRPECILLRSYYHFEATVVFPHRPYRFTPLLCTAQLDFQLQLFIFANCFTIKETNTHIRRSQYKFRSNEKSKLYSVFVGLILNIEFVTANGIKTSTGVFFIFVFFFVRCG